MKKIMALAAFVLLLSTNTVFARDLCDDYKSRADHFNDLMREHRVTEGYKRGHRYWMDKYYRCTIERDNPSRQTTNKARSSESVTRVIKQPLSPTKPVKFTKNIEMTGYHAFKGAKKRAWERFFVESEKCKRNSNDMATFVKCSEERKIYLARFEAMWNDATQSLESPIE